MHNHPILTSTGHTDHNKPMANTDNTHAATRCKCAGCNHVCSACRKLVPKAIQQLAATKANNTNSNITVT